MDQTQQIAPEDAGPHGAALPRRVLIVDDDPIQRAQICHYLRDQGYHCLEAENGTQAVESLEAHHPEAVLLDIKMPDISGIEVAGIVADMEPQPRIILMSGYLDAVNEAKRANLKVFAVIEKPVPLRAIAHFLHQAFLAPAPGEASQSDQP